MQITILNTTITFDENKLDDNARKLLDCWLELRAEQLKLFTQSQMQTMQALGRIMDIADVEFTVSKKPTYPRF